MKGEVFLLLTADCEPARIDLTHHALKMSPSGPRDYAESERAIRGYAAVAKAHGFPLTLFVHPEVAVQHRELLLELEAGGACLGLHLHPYKFLNGEYREDLGAYSAATQYEILNAATRVWEDALGKRPLYFRAGYFSANDNTFRVLYELGFRGGSLSNPGRILPEHQSVWAGAEPYPHRAHFDFRQIKGNSNFAEVPIAVDYQQPLKMGAAGEKGYAWPYIPANYRHPDVIRGILERIRRDEPPIATIVLDTHNDQDYSDPAHPAKRNLELILDSVESLCAELGMPFKGATLEQICDLVLSEDICIM